MLHFVAKFQLQLVEIGFVGGVELFADVGKIDHITVSEFLVRTVDPCQRLQQVVPFDHPSEVQFL